MRGNIKHCLQCAFLIFFILLFLIFAGIISISGEDKKYVDPIETYGLWGTLVLYLLRLLTLLTIRQVIFNFGGLVLFNAFPGTVKLKSSSLMAPFICICVVTRGDFPELVRNNVTRNMNLCIEVGMKNFMIEVVTDKAIGLPQVSCYSWVTLPFSTSNIILAALCPIPCPYYLDLICGFIGAVNIYMYIFGVIKSFSLYRFGPFSFILFICGALSTIPINIVIEYIAVIWGVVGKKHKFYVVNKHLKRLSLWDPVAYV